MFRKCIRSCLLYSDFVICKTHHQVKNNLSKQLQQFRLITICSNLSNNSLEVCGIDRRDLSELLSSRLSLSGEQCHEILEANKFMLTRRYKDIQNALDICDEMKITREVLLKNLDLLNFDEKVLLSKFGLLRRLKLKDINYGVPFLKIPYTKLMALARRQSKIQNFSDRINLIAGKLKIHAYDVAESVSQKTYVFSVDTNQLTRALDMLVECGMTSENIMKDWWIVRYKPEIIKERLEVSKKSGKKKLKTWMVKCSDTVFQRSIYLENNEKIELLGGEKPLKKYIEEKLECSPEHVESMCTTFPRLHRVRVVKVKGVYEFLIEKGFSKQDMVKAPKIFAHSIKTIASRLEFLNELGYKVTNLNNVCKSIKAFEKFTASLKNSKMLY